jgi:hypothetical protein
VRSERRRVARLELRRVVQSALRQTAELEQRVAAAQKQIERENRNVRKKRRKAGHRSWYKIRPWCDP